jgi:hypothetical protein
MRKLMCAAMALAALSLYLSPCVFAQPRSEVLTGVANGPSTDTPDDSITVTIQLAPNWNMVSNPVITVNDSVQVLFPICLGCPVPPPFYADSCRLPHGRGRWLKCPTGGTVSITGMSLHADTIVVATNWNIIGSISYPVAASSVTSIPPNIIRSRFFGFSSGYVPVDTLRPGSAYWVKTNQSGWIVLSAGF